MLIGGFLGVGGCGGFLFDEVGVEGGDGFAVVEEGFVFGVVCGE